MEGLTVLFAALKDAPAAVTLTVAFVTAIFAIFLYSRKINIEDVTSIGKTLSTQLKSQAALVASLSDQIAELHAQNIHLMAELRKANHKIDELEDVLREYQRGGGPKP